MNRFLSRLLNLTVALGLVGDTVSAADGRALALEGVGAYAVADDAPSLDLGANGGSFTLEAYVYVPRADLSGVNTILYKNWAHALAVNFRTGTADYVFFRLWGTPGGLEGQNYFTLGASVEVTVGWHHVAAVYSNRPGDAADLSALYWDGQLLAASESLGLDPGSYASTLPVQVGAYVGVNPWEGMIDEVRLSSSVRYSGSSFPVPTAPFTPDADTVALWHFEEGAGALTFADSSAHGNTLTSKGGATTTMTGEVVSAPELAIQREAGQLVVSWPESATGYRLEMSEDFSAPIAWHRVTNAPMLSQGRQTILLSQPQRRRFFRLTR